MPTGTLSVNTEIPVNHVVPSGLDNCSLICQWTSKANSLSATDNLLLQEPQQLTSFPKRVDFLSALESLKPKPSGDGYDHDYFIVPKHCNVCYWHDGNGWRKSWCMAEIITFVNEMSDKHTTFHLRL